MKRKAIVLAGVAVAILLVTASLATYVHSRKQEHFATEPADAVAPGFAMVKNVGTGGNDIMSLRKNVERAEKRLPEDKNFAVYCQERCEQMNHATDPTKRCVGVFVDAPSTNPDDDRYCWLKHKLSYPGVYPDGTATYIRKGTNMFTFFQGRNVNPNQAQSQSSQMTLAQCSAKCDESPTCAAIMRPTNQENSAETDCWLVSPVTTVSEAALGINEDSTKDMFTRFTFN